MRWFFGVLVLLALLAGAGLYRDRLPLGWATEGEAAPAEPAAPPATVAAAPVALERVRREIQAVGSLRSNESVIVRPEIAGRITEILFAEGQRATKGEPLVRLDAAIARAQVEQAKASLVLSRANYERAQDLFARKVGTQRSLDEAVSSLRADEAALALAEATLGKSTILAPFDGIIGLRSVSVGAYVTPGQDLVNFENVESLKVDFRIPEIYALQLAVGQKVRITLDAIPDAVYEGEVYAIDPAHDPNGRAVILRARLPNTDGKLRSGMFARVGLLIDDRREAIMVPETALVPVGQDHFVFRIVDDKAILAKVEIGQRQRGRIEILSGLDRDAVIVVEGALKLRDGSAVRVVGPGAV
jgi:membrane fusion protein, multidrug efflux system